MDIRPEFLHTGIVCNSARCNPNSKNMPKKVKKARSGNGSGGARRDKPLPPAHSAEANHGSIHKRTRSQTPHTPPATKKYDHGKDSDSD